MTTKINDKTKQYEHQKIEEEITTIEKGKNLIAYIIQLIILLIIVYGGYNNEFRKNILKTIINRIETMLKLVTKLLK
jgi:hypothetical protein